MILLEQFSVEFGVESSLVVFYRCLHIEGRQHKAGHQTLVSYQPPVLTSVLGVLNVLIKFLERRSQDVRAHLWLTDLEVRHLPALAEAAIRRVISNNLLGLYEITSFTRLRLLIKLLLHHFAIDSGLVFAKRMPARTSVNYGISRCSTVWTIARVLQITDPVNAKV